LHHSGQGRRRFPSDRDLIAEKALDSEMTSAQRLSIADVTLASFRTRPEALFNASDVIAE